jgi:hypothetical protein
MTLNPEFRAIRFTHEMLNIAHEPSIFGMTTGVSTWLWSHRRWISARMQSGSSPYCLLLMSGLMPKLMAKGAIREAISILPFGTTEITMLWKDRPRVMGYEPREDCVEISLGAAPSIQEGASGWPFDLRLPSWLQTGESLTAVYDINKTKQNLILELNWMEELLGADMFYKLINEQWIKRVMNE